MTASNGICMLSFLIRSLCPNNNIRNGKEALEIGSLRSSRLNAGCYVAFLTLRRFWPIDAC